MAVNIKLFDFYAFFFNFYPRLTPYLPYWVPQSCTRACSPLATIVIWPLNLIPCTNIPKNHQKPAKEEIIYAIFRIFAIFTPVYLHISHIVGLYFVEVSVPYRQLLLSGSWTWNDEWSSRIIMKNRKKTLKFCNFLIFCNFYPRIATYLWQCKSPFYASVCSL